MADQLTDEQIAEFKEAFDLFDHDNTGSIGIAELGTVLRTLGHSFSETEIEMMIKEADENNNGKLDFPEFLLIMAKKMKDSDMEEELNEVFKIFDREGKGFIDVSELRTIMNTMGEKLPLKEVDDIIREAGLEEEINYPEVIKSIISML